TGLPSGCFLLALLRPTGSLLTPSPVRPHRGHTGPDGHSNPSRCSRALFSSAKIGLVSLSDMAGLVSASHSTYTACTVKYLIVLIIISFDSRPSTGFRLKPGGTNMIIGFRAGLFALLAACLVSASPPARSQSYDHITIATNAEPDTLDMLTSVFPPISYVVLRNVDEMLWGYNIDGTVRPTVADWMVSPDAKTITFHIHPGVKFHSGDELVADDVLFSFKRMMSNTPSFKRHARLVKSVDKLDDYTVRFTWDHPDVTFFDGMQIFMGSKAYFDRVGEKEFMTHPSGIGPYKLVKYAAGQYIDLERFDGYYGTKPKVKAARFAIIKDDETRLAKLRAGEADIVMNAPYPNVAELEKDGFHLVKFPANPSVSIVFDLLTPQSPWHTREVREAIAHAIDPNAIIKGLFHGVPYRYPMLAPGEAGYDPNLKNYDYNPALSKKLLAEAGYSNGFKMPLYYSATSFYGFRQAAEVVALYLKAIGIECELHNQEAVQGLQM